MPVLVGNAYDIPEMSLNVSFDLDLVKSVGEKYRQSRKGFIAESCILSYPFQYKTDQISLRRKLCCFVEIAVCFLLFFSKLCFGVCA